MVTNRKLGRKLMSVFVAALMFASVFTTTAIADNNFTEKPMPYMAAVGKISLRGG